MLTRITRQVSRMFDLKCEVGSFGLFPGGEGHHHLIGETAVSVLTDNFVTFKPLCDGKLLVIYGKGIVAVYIAEKSKKQRPGELTTAGFCNSGDF